MRQKKIVFLIANCGETYRGQFARMSKQYEVVNAHQMCVCVCVFVSVCVCVGGCVGLS